MLFNYLILCQSKLQLQLSQFDNSDYDYHNENLLKNLQFNS